jgi:hypothetical protein
MNSMPSSPSGLDGYAMASRSAAKSGGEGVMVVDLALFALRID